MKFLLHTFLIAIFAYFVGLLFPWWTLIVCAFLIAAVIPTTAFKAFLSGFLGGGLLWLFGALAYSIENDFLLTNRIGDLLMGISAAGVVGLSFLIGALAGGMGALAGNQARDIFRRPPSPRKYGGYRA
jgi:hypothetical protein